MAEGNESEATNPTPVKPNNKVDGAMMAGGYILGWIIFIIFFRRVYRRYRESQSNNCAHKICHILILYSVKRKQRWLVRKERRERGL